MGLINYCLEMYSSLTRGKKPRYEQQRRVHLCSITRYDVTGDKEEYQRALASGELKEMRGQHIAYHNRRIIATAHSEIGLAHMIIEQGLEGKCLLVEVGAGSIELGF